jgi:hypothetical protein
LPSSSKNSCKLSIKACSISVSRYLRFSFSSKNSKRYGSLRYSSAPLSAPIFGFHRELRLYICHAKQAIFGDKAYLFVAQTVENSNCTLHSLLCKNSRSLSFGILIISL